MAMAVSMAVHELISDEHLRKVNPSLSSRKLRNFGEGYNVGDLVFLLPNLNMSMIMFANCQI